VLGSASAGVGDVAEGVGTGDDGELVGVGVGDAVGEATGQVAVLVLCGWADVAGLGTSGPGTWVDGVVGDTCGVPSVRLDCAPFVTEDVVGGHLAVEAGCGFTVRELAAAVGAGPATGCPPPDGAPPDGAPPDGAPPAAGVPLPPSMVRAPLPSVLALTCCGPLPPFSAALAWRIACLNG
jgi:hypothetical protein